MFSLAALIPLILVLMTVTGAVYPAIDLTAGERERGTLEMLIAAPVPRVGLLLAKYVAVLAVALLTAIVNLTGMAITSHSTGLNVSLFGGAGLSLPVVIKVLLLLGLVRGVFLGRAAGDHQLCAKLQGGAGVHHSADAAVPGAGRDLPDAEPRVHRRRWQSCRW